MWEMENFLYFHIHIANTDTEIMDIHMYVYYEGNLNRSRQDTVLYMSLELKRKLHGNKYYDICRKRSN